MKQEYRLKKAADFKKTMNFSRSKRTGAYLVFVRPNDLNHARYGISTSKKLGNAVTRVRIRRQIRAYLAIYNNYKIGYDIVIVARQGFLKKTHEENQSELLEAISLLIENKGEKK